MGEMSPDEVNWLVRIGRAPGRVWPDRPFLRAKASLPLMRSGLVEVVKPPAPYLPYATLTNSGREVLASLSLHPDPDQ